MMKNLVLRIGGAISLFIGANTLHRQILQGKFKKDQDSVKL